jgi:hypothetical protein
MDSNVSPALTEFKEIRDKNLSGIALFDMFKSFLNSHYSDGLSLIAGRLLRSECKDDVLNDESLVLTKVAVHALDRHGLDLEVVVCSSSYCWLKIIPVQFSEFCDDANSLFCMFDELVQSALIGKMEAQIPSDYDVIPEFLTSAIKLMNGDFADYLKETVNKLGGVDEGRGEHIRSVYVTNLDDSGFDCETVLCRQSVCSELKFRITFPRKARNSQDLQWEIVQCLEEGACTIDWDTFRNS